jgi:hypothetical protein
MWNLVGVVAALAVAGVAWQRSRVAGGFYDAQVYAMTRAIHRRYALVSLAFAACFAVAFATHADTLGLAALAVYAVIAIIYATSFLRGASDYE